MKLPIKEMMTARNLLAKKGMLNVVVNSIIYDDQYNIRCVDAVYDDKEGNCSAKTHTWFIPSEMAIQIEVGDALIVEQTIGNGPAIVRAVSTVYEKSSTQHELDLHPYCPVITNIGKALQTGTL